MVLQSLYSGIPAFALIDPPGIFFLPFVCGYFHSPIWAQFRCLLSLQDLRTLILGSLSLP